MKISILSTSGYDGLAMEAALNILEKVTKMAISNNQEKSIQQVMVEELKRYGFSNDYEAAVVMCLTLYLNIYESIATVAAPDWIGGRDDGYDPIENISPENWVKVCGDVFQSPTAISNEIHCSPTEFYKQLEAIGYARREGNKWFPTSDAASVSRYHGRQLRWHPQVGLLVWKNIQQQRQDRKKNLLEIEGRFKAGRPRRDSDTPP